MLRLQEFMGIPDFVDDARWNGLRKSYRPAKQVTFVEMNHFIAINMRFQYGIQRVC